MSTGQVNKGGVGGTGVGAWGGRAPLRIFETLPGADKQLRILVNWKANSDVPGVPYPRELKDKRCNSICTMWYISL